MKNHWQGVTLLIHWWFLVSESVWKLYHVVIEWILCIIEKVSIKNTLYLKDISKKERKQDMITDYSTTLKKQILLFILSYSSLQILRAVPSCAVPACVSTRSPGVSSTWNTSKCFKTLATSHPNFVAKQIARQYRSWTAHSSDTVPIQLIKNSLIKLTG